MEHETEGGERKERENWYGQAIVVAFFCNWVRVPKTNRFSGIIQVILLGDPSSFYMSKSNWLSGTLPGFRFGIEGAIQEYGSNSTGIELSEHQRHQLYIVHCTLSTGTPSMVGDSLINYTISIMARTKRTKRLYLDDKTEDPQGSKAEEKEPSVFSVQKDRRKRHKNKMKVVLDSDEEQSSKKPAPVKVKVSKVSAKFMQPKLMMPFEATLGLLMPLDDTLGVSPLNTASITPEKQLKAPNPRLVEGASVSVIQNDGCAASKEGKINNTIQTRIVTTYVVLFLLLIHLSVSPFLGKINILHHDDLSEEEVYMMSLMGQPYATEQEENNETKANQENKTNTHIRTDNRGLDILIRVEFIKGNILLVHCNYEVTNDGGFVMQGVMGLRRQDSDFMGMDLGIVDVGRAGNSPPNESETKRNQYDDYCAWVFIIPINTYTMKYKKSNECKKMLERFATFLQTHSYSKKEGVVRTDSFNTYIVPEHFDITPATRSKLTNQIMLKDAITIVKTVYPKIAGPEMYEQNMRALSLFFSGPPYHPMLQQFGCPV